MATTRIMPLHVGKGRTESRAISDIIDYVANPKKTDNGRLITGYACDSRTADAEFLLAKRQYIAATGRVRGTDDVIAYHVRQSFRPGEITPEEANRLGVEFAKRFTKGNHAFVVCTHIDKSHIHNHIIWSSVSLEYDRKFRNFWGSTKAVRRLSDTICIENGLSIVENPKLHGKSYNKWLGDQAKPSHRELLRVAIDNALSQSPADFEELLKLLQEYGCEVSKRGKSYRLKLSGWEKAARMDSLGEGYGLEDLRAVLLRSCSKGGRTMNDILFGNNNKAVIKKLANRSFRSNKMRNVIAVIAIALTTFLFTAVLTIGMGAKGTLEYNMAKMIGTGADALVQGLSEEQFQQLKENSMFEKVGCWVPIEIMTNTNRMVAEIDYADQPQLELRMQTPRTGSAPQKANEVLVSANILKDLNIEEKIGAEIPIEFKNRQSGQMYHFDMIVSGIYDTPNEKSESVIVSKAFMEENPEMMREIAQGREGCGIYDADVIMRDSSMVKERISEFVRSIGGNPDDRSAENYVRVAPNTFLSNNSGGSIMWLVAGVFGVLFMFCGYLLIYNVFEIAVTNDIRQYGLLRTVGTTSQQIKRLVNRQALYLFLIGTPFGLLFGILLGRSILPAALQMFAADYSGKNIEVSTLPYLGIIVGAILFSGLTVYISTRKSVKKASRVSPIEAIRYVEQDTVSIKRKKTNTGAVIPRMAKANLQRNKRRTVFIVISLTLSIVLLNSVFIFSGSFDEATYVQKQTRSDFAVYNPDIQAAWGDEFGHSCTVSEKSVEEIEQQPGVMNEVRLYRNTFEDDHIACDWGPSFSIDNTNKYAYVLPDSLNLGWTEDGEDYAALTADNLPLGN